MVRWTRAKVNAVAATTREMRIQRALVAAEKREGTIGRRSIYICEICTISDELYTIFTYRELKIN